MEFTKRELQVMSDREFLIVKATTSSKIHELLAETRSALTQQIALQKLTFPPEKVLTRGKISKGENYLGLPYQVLDFPALFTSKNIFAYRTMFWWGNFFSCTLHLQGAALDLYRKKIIENISLLEKHEVFLSVGKTPWQYHYGVDNYKLVTHDDIMSMKKNAFLKLSVKMKLDRWHELPAFSTAFFQRMLDILNS